VIEIDTDQKEESRDAGRWNYIKLTMKNTGMASTVHGIPNILANQEWSFKLLWTVCCWLLNKGANDCLKYDGVTTIKRVPEVPSVFPTVTICNTNLITNQVAYDYAMGNMRSDRALLKAAAEYYEEIRYSVQ
jgi:hypothetical protein